MFFFLNFMVFCKEMFQLYDTQDIYLLKHFIIRRFKMARFYFLRQQSDLEYWTRLTAFHFVLMPLENAWINAFHPAIIGEEKLKIQTNYKSLKKLTFCRLFCPN